MDAPSSTPTPPKPLFRPPWPLRNPHLQNITSSVGARRWVVTARTRMLEQHAQRYLLDCDQSVRLLADYTPNPRAPGLMVLLHGWEGSSQAPYMRSAAQALHQAGFAVLRLNLRDHGHSQHLNRELFHSARLADVAGALKCVQQLWPHHPLGLAGFSLGGTLALLLAAGRAGEPPPLRMVAAICPVVDGHSNMMRLAQGPAIYQNYFRNKWRRSLWRKLGDFPELRFGHRFLREPSLLHMEDYFVRGFTGFNTVTDYHAAYRLDGAALTALRIPAHIIACWDDPIVPIEQLMTLPRAPQVQLEVSRYGGHCGLLESWRLTSWADRRLAEMAHAAFKSDSQ